ncbi:MAG: hypothetical protein AAGF85_20400 [Bacteroidota bacterium]
MHKTLTVSLLSVVLYACHNQKTINGHWHEIYKGEVTHCYRITDSTYSIDQISLGFMSPIEIINSKKALYSMLVSEYTVEYLLDQDVIQFNDSISWKRAEDNHETFLNDLSLGLLVQITPVELLEEQFDLSYEHSNVIIFIGKSKSDLAKTAVNIQLNDVISTIDTLPDFLDNGHDENTNQIMVINADRSTPDSLITLVAQHVLNSGYSKSNIYQTAISPWAQEIGLIKLKKADELESQLFPPCL